MQYKAFKCIALVWFTIGIASAVKNWGNELTENPIFVSVCIILGAMTFALFDLMDGE